MGKQQKLKAMRRAIKQRRKQDQVKAVSKHLVTNSLPDLGVSVAEMVNTKDKFG